MNENNNILDLDEIKNKINNFKILRNLININNGRELDTQFNPIIKDIIKLISHNIIYNKKDDFPFSKYNDDKTIFLYEQLAELQENKLLNFCRFLNMKNNIKNLEDEYKDIPKENNIDELTKFYFNLKEKRNNNNYFDKNKEVNDKECILLKENLHKKSIHQYFLEQLDKFKTKINLDIKKMIENGNISLAFDKALNKNDLVIINKVYTNLIQKIKDTKKYYGGKYNYGFSLLKGKIFFYDYGDKNILFKILSNTQDIKKYKYDEEESNDLSVSIISENSNNSISKKPTNEIVIKNSLLKGISFENNVILTLEKILDHNQLFDLPPYLFPMAKDDNINTNKNLVEYKMKNMFNYYIEIDKAILNPSNEDIYSKDNITLPFIIYNTINYPEDIGPKFPKDENNKDKNRIVLTKKSINLFEAKFSAPNNKRLDLKYEIKNKDDKEYNEYRKSLEFTLLNLISKIGYYKDLVMNEFLDSDDDINKYKFNLFLIYDNKPILDLEKEIIKSLGYLKVKNLISNNNCSIISIYVSPSIDNFNYGLVSDELKQVENELKTKVANLKLDMSVMENKLNKAIKSNEIKIAQMKISNEELIKNNEGLKKNNEELKINTEELKKQNNLLQKILKEHESSCKFTLMESLKNNQNNNSK